MEQIEAALLLIEERLDEPDTYEKLRELQADTPAAHRSKWRWLWEAYFVNGGTVPLATGE